MKYDKNSYGAKRASLKSQLAAEIDDATHPDIDFVRPRTEAERYIWALKFSPWEQANAATGGFPHLTSFMGKEWSEGPLATDVAVDLKRELILAHRRYQRSLRSIKRRSDALGLAFWPALHNTHGADPRAFVIAEEVLCDQRGLPRWGEPNGKERSHGCWDSEGHYGLTAKEVADLWLAAGCKDSAKYRWLLRHTKAPANGGGGSNAVEAKHLKSLGLDKCRLYLRGYRWLSSERSGALGPYNFGSRAIVTLGRLSALARVVATRHLLGEYPNDRKNGRWGVRDLDLGAVAEFQKLPKAIAAQKYLLGTGNMAWWFLHGERAPHKELRHASPVGWKKGTDSQWRSRRLVGSFQPDPWEDKVNFDIPAPAGWRFGVDSLGIKVVNTRTPDVDYHLNEEEFKELLLGEREIGEFTAQAVKNAETRSAVTAAAGQEFQQALKTGTTVLLEDSLRAGNCRAGSLALAKRIGFTSEEAAIPAKAIWDIALRTSLSDRAIRAIVEAFRRETLVSI